MTDNTYCVYKHTSPSNKVYIGITKMKPIKRWGKDGSGYKDNCYFWRAIQKYGWENFEHEVLFENLTKEEACDKEIELISMYDSTNPINGYNLSTGGECGGAGICVSEETRQKISEILGRVILQFSKNGELLSEYVSVRTAAKTLNISPKIINDCCNKHRKSAGGYIWRYKDLYDPNEIIAYDAKINPTPKVVVQLDKNGNFISQYENAYEAEEITGIHQSGICNCCIGKIKSAGNYIWKYLSDYDPNDKIIYYDKTGPKTILQFDLDGNLIAEYESMSIASQSTGVSMACISRCCNNKRKTSGGYVWKYKGEQNIYASYVSNM